LSTSAAVITLPRFGGARGPEDSVMAVGGGDTRALLWGLRPGFLILAHP